MRQITEHHQHWPARSAGAFDTTGNDIPKFNFCRIIQDNIVSITTEVSNNHRCAADVNRSTLWQSIKSAYHIGAALIVNNQVGRTGTWCKRTRQNQICIGYIHDTSVSSSNDPVIDTDAVNMDAKIVTILKHEAIVGRGHPNTRQSFGWIDISIGTLGTVKQSIDCQVSANGSREQVNFNCVNDSRICKRASL